MKKFILGLAFLSIATISFNASAQNCNNNKNCDNKCVAEKCDKKCDNKCDSKCDNDKKACPGMNCDFAALNLTDQQKSKIEALRKAMMSSRDELREQAKKARESKDTTFNARKAMLDMRTKYVNDLGEILTPAQYVEFLKNYFINNPGGNKSHFGKGGSPMMGKDFKGKDGKNKSMSGKRDGRRDSGRHGNRNQSTK